MRTMACARSVTWSLLKMLEMWLRTVLALRTSRLAISALLWPWAISPEDFALAVGGWETGRPVRPA